MSWESKRTLPNGSSILEDYLDVLLEVTVRLKVGIRISSFHSLEDEVFRVVLYPTNLEMVSNCFLQSGPLLVLMEL